MDQLSKQKEFAIELMDMFDELMRPELKSSWAIKIWSFIPGFVKKRILKKPDNEINEKMLVIYKKMKNHFKDLDTSIEIQAYEQLNDIKIPRIGQLGKQADTIDLSEKQAEEILKELNL